MSSPWDGSMLSEAQLAYLEHIVHSISAELHIEEATLEGPADVNVGAV